jgi:hypothetical protein
MMIVNVVLSAELSQDGLAIDTLMKKQTQIKNDIREIEQQVLVQTSLSDLSAKAQLLQYINPDSVVTINALTPLAYKCK